MYIEFQRYDKRMRSHQAQAIKNEPYSWIEYFEKSKNKRKQMVEKCHFFETLDSAYNTDRI